MKVLHISHHNGCVEELNFIAKQLNFEIETFRYPYGYNIGIKRAEESWNQFKDLFNQFDFIITSDTAPLSRIIYKHIDKLKGKLIIWVCNRFDYADMATNDCGFPDSEYYKEFRNIVNHPKIQIVSYTQFEHFYAKYERNVDFGNLTIEPTGGIERPKEFKSLIPDSIKEKLFFIPQYHNDSIFMDLGNKCNELGIYSRQGRYNGIYDLQGFKAIIHIPYAWSNLAFWQACYLGIPYMIPSKRFLFDLSVLGNFFWSPPFIPSCIDLSEWYNPKHEEFLIYFNSWNELRDLSKNSELLKNKGIEAQRFNQEHINRKLNQWIKLFGT